MSCNSTGVGETPFNTDNNVQPVVGIMFEVQSKSTALTLRTMVLDAKLDDANGNLAIEIYQSSSAVASSFSNANAWEQIALTRLVPHPEAGSGAIVPTWEFTGIEMAANTKKSIYVRLKGAYIDNNVDSSKDAGDLAYETPDLDVYTGWYLRPEDPVFPDSQTADPAPMFAGKLYYDLHLDCSAVPLTNTDVVFLMAMDLKPITEYDALEAAAYDSFESLLGTDAVLKGMVKRFGLVQVEDGVEVELVNYNGECPSAWISCHVIRTTMQFQHSSTIDKGEVEERMYTHALDISAEQLKVMAEGTKGAYVGFVDVEANFELSLVGVSETNEMDTAQTKYLQDQIRDHVNRQVNDDVIRITTVFVKNQELFDYDSVKVQGTIHGMVLAVFATSDFALRVKNALKVNDEEFINYLRFNLMYPGPMSENKRYQYFLGASELSDVEVTEVTITAPPTPAPTAGEDLVKDGLDKVEDTVDSDWLIWVGVAVGVLVLLIILCFVYRYISRNRRLQQEREDRRADRKAKESKKQESTRVVEEVIIDERVTKSSGKPGSNREIRTEERYTKSTGKSGSGRSLRSEESRSKTSVKKGSSRSSR